LKDYVNGKLLFAHPPPGLSEVEFNKLTHELALRRAIKKKRAPVTRVGKNADTFVPSNLPPTRSDGGSLPLVQGLKSLAIDGEFFGSNTTLSARPFVRGSVESGQEFTRARLFPHQNSVGDDGAPLRRRDQSMVGDLGKKTHKKAKRVKQRSGKGYD
jgi:large subunit GTPase 1